MPKSPTPAKNLEMAQGNKAELPSRRLRRPRTSGRRNFLKTTGLAAAGAMAAKPLKAMLATNEGWLKAVELSRLGDIPESYSMSISGWIPQPDPTWCWATAASNALSSLGAVSPCEVVDTILNEYDTTYQINTYCTSPPGSICCESPIPSGCENYGSFEAAYGYFDSFGCGNSDFDDICGHIYPDGLVVAYIGYCGSGGYGGGGDGCDWISPPGSNGISQCGGDPCSGSNVSFAHYLTIFGYWVDGGDYDYGFWVFDTWGSTGVSSVSLMYGSFPQSITTHTQFASSNWWTSIYV